MSTAPSLELRSHRRALSLRTIKIIAIVYAVKTLLFGMAWLIVPDLPQRTCDTARQAWARLMGEGDRN